MFMTQHAEQRCLERQISPQQLEWLLCYGQESHNRGVRLCFFDRAGFSQLLRELDLNGSELALRSRNIYAVLGESTVITVGYRDKRLKPRKPNKRIRRVVPPASAAISIHHRTRNSRDEA